MLLLIRLAPTILRHDNLTMHMVGFTSTSRHRQLAMAMSIIMEIMRRAKVNAHVIIRKLSHLRIIHTEDLRLLVAAHATAGDVVHDPEDDGGHDEGVAEACGGVGELVGELDVVVVEPAAWDDGDVVEPGDGGLCEEACEEVADDSANGVRGEDLLEGEEIECQQRSLIR